MPSKEQSSQDPAKKSFRMDIERYLEKISEREDELLSSVTQEIYEALGTDTLKGLHRSHHRVSNTRMIIQTDPANSL